MVSPKPKLIREVRGGRVIYRTAPSSQQDLSSDRQSQPTYALNRELWDAGLSLLLLLASGLTVVGTGWLGYQAITNPDVAFVLNQLLPVGRQPAAIASEATPQTLNQIEAALNGQFQTPGQRLIVSSARSSSETNILIPVLATALDCLAPCSVQVKELRFYRSLAVPSVLRLFQTQRYFRLVDKVAISEFPPDQLQDGEHSLLDDQLLPPTLPFSQVQPFLEKLPTAGSWLSLSGSLSQSKGTIGYGQIWYVDSERNRLIKLLSWSNPTGVLPRWQKVNGAPALIIDQTVGGIARSQIYRLQIEAAGQEDRVSLRSLPTSDSPPLNR